MNPLLRCWNGLFWGLLFLLAGCNGVPDGPMQDTGERMNDEDLAAVRLHDPRKGAFTFGFDLRSSPQEDARQYLPFLQYLERKTGYRFTLRFTPQDASIVDDLGTGKVDFAAVGAVSHIQAQERYGAIPLARGLNRQGAANYRSYIVVRPDSTLRTVKDLRGKRLAFGGTTSTQGHLIPRIVLSKHGVALEDLGDYNYTGSHQNCADAVVSGRFDACGMQDTLAQNLADRGRVRVLHVSDYYPSSGIVVNKDVPPDARERIRQAILQFDPRGRDAAGLYNWENTEMPNGFVAAQADDYVPLKTWLIRLGLLDGRT